MHYKISVPVGSTIGYLKVRCLNKIMDLRKKRCQGPEDQRSKSGPFHVSKSHSEQYLVLLM